MSSPDDRRAIFDASYGPEMDDLWRERSSSPAGAIVRLAEAGKIVGAVLDAGCGLGENATYLASLGHPTLGVDFAPNAIRRAGARAAERGIPVEFIVHDALDLAALGRTFDTVIDVGLFDCLSDAERRRYVASLAAVVRPGGRVFASVWGFQPSGRTLRPREIRRTFGFGGWKVEAVRPEWVDNPFRGQRVSAWLAQILRVGAAA